MNALPARVSQYFRVISVKWTHDETLFIYWNLDQHRSGTETLALRPERADFARERDIATDAKSQ